MAYEILWERRGVVKRFFARVTAQEIMDATIATEADIRFDDYRYVINDFTDCVDYVDDNVVIEEIAAIDGVAELLNSKIRIAVVATLPNLVSTAEAYAQSQLHHYEIRIFPTLDAARVWLADVSA